MATTFPPRSAITADSFSVAPELLGQPLARPWRRAVAMLIDLALIAFLVGLDGAFLGAIAAFLLLRLFVRLKFDQRLSARVTRWIRFGLATTVFVLGIVTWRSATGGSDQAEAEGDSAPSEGQTSFGDVDLDLTVSDAIGLARRSAGLRNQHDPLKAQQEVDSLWAILQRAGVTPDQLPQVRDQLHEVAESRDNAVVRAAIDSTFGTPLVETAQRRDSLARAYAAALQGQDSAHLEPLRAALTNALSESRVSRLQEELADEEREKNRLQEEVDHLRARGSIRAFVSGFADDMGLGLGWSAVYFTAFLAMMRGQTPGKRLLRVRVVRLDARRVGWWIAFERFGGYFASLTLGLLGFLQILWDRNRQGLHDKAVETVVIKS